MSNNYRPQGSEKIQDPAVKLDRIREIAGIGQKPALNENKLNTKFSTVLHEAVAADGNTYGLVQEGPKVFLKRLVNDHYDYMTGDEKDYAYKDFATAFKHMNFVFKDISEQSNHSDQINIFEGGLTEKKNLTERFILKTPQAQAPVSQDVAPPAPPAAGMPPAGGDPSMAPPADPQASQQLGQEIGSVEGQVEDQDPAKAMQKMVGKLTEKMRTADEQIMTSEFMKGILNSVISAIDTSKLEDGDLLSIMKKLKGEDNPEQAGEPDPNAQSEFTDDSGIDYNVNNQANEAPPAPVQEDLDAAGNTGMQPTWDDQVVPDILAKVIENIGVEINGANEEELRQAVTLFVNTYGGDQNQTDFMKQLQDYVSNTGSNDVNTGNLRYSSLSPMGQQVFDQLELLDPSMGELNGSGENTNSQFQTNTNDSFQTPTSNTGKLSFTGMNETQSFLKDKIMEALKTR